MVAIWQNKILLVTGQTLRLPSRFAAKGKKVKAKGRLSELVLDLVLEFSRLKASQSENKIR